MSVIINFENCKFSENSKVMNNATISTSSNINLKKVELSGNAEVLQNLNISDFCMDVQSVADRMSQAERESMQRLMSKKNSGKTEFLKLLAQHLASFAEGVAANVVAAYLTR